MPKKFWWEKKFKFLPWENGPFVNVDMLRYCLHGVKHGKGKHCTLICAILPEVNSKFWNHYAITWPHGGPEEAESWFGCQFTAGSWDVLGCCSPISILVPLMLWIVALCQRFSISCSFPPSPSPPKILMCHASSGAPSAAVRWRWQVTGGVPLLHGCDITQF